MNEYLDSLERVFISHAQPEIAVHQKAYMRNQFEFFGIKAPIRKSLQKPFFVKKSLPKKEYLDDIIRILWEKPQREFQFFGQELTQKYARNFVPKDITILEYMVQHKSWWDTVDFIAAHLMGNYFKRYPETRLLYTDKWLVSENIWLQRSALLFQLKYKDQLDTKLLENVINRLLGSREFFINKAIGWILREYSKTDPVWVRDFADRTPLEPLSRKEAVRLIKPTGITR